MRTVVFTPEEGSTRLLPRARPEEVVEPSVEIKMVVNPSDLEFELIHGGFSMQESACSSPCSRLTSLANFM